jgi:hypothetical protein
MPAGADSVRAVSATMSRLRALPVAGPAAVIAGALALRLIAGVGFANYDTLYGLAWGGQLAQGETPAYGVAIAPTPHPLLEILGVILRPLSPHLEIEVVVALGFLALAGCGWMIFRLGEAWFGRAAGALAALVFLTRVPVISYGVRAYLDLPYLWFVLGALALRYSRCWPWRDSCARRPGSSPVSIGSTYSACCLHGCWRCCRPASLSASAGGSSG